MNHTLKIGVCAEKHPPGGLVSLSRVTLRERIVRLLLGEQRRLTVIVPGNTVKTVSIFEEGENAYEQNQTAT